MDIRLLLEHAETLKKVQELRDEADELEKTLPREVVQFLHNGNAPRPARKSGRSSQSDTRSKDDAVLAAGRMAVNIKGEFKRSEMKEHLPMEPYAGKSQHNTESDISNSLRRLVESGKLHNVNGRSGYYRIAK